jgi:hypothetical protein
MPSKKNKHVKYRAPRDTPTQAEKIEVPPTADERALVCAQAIVDAQIKMGGVTQDGIVKMLLRQFLEHEDAATNRVILLCRHMAEQEEVEGMAAKDVLLALAADLESIKQPPPPAQPGVVLP